MVCPQRSSGTFHPPHGCSPQETCSSWGLMGLGAHTVLKAHECLAGRLQVVAGDCWFPTRGVAHLRWAVACRRHSAARGVRARLRARVHRGSLCLWR